MSVEIRNQQQEFKPQAAFSQEAISKKFSAIPCAFSAFAVSSWRRPLHANATY
jgi:hypothetical protein